MSAMSTTRDRKVDTMPRVLHGSDVLCWMPCMRVWRRRRLWTMYIVTSMDTTVRTSRTTRTAINAATKSC